MSSRCPTTGVLVKCTSNYALYKQPHEQLPYPQLMRFINASITAHCASSQVNTCHAVPTTGFLGKLSLLVYITKQLTERNNHNVASTVELQLSRLIGTASHPVMLKIRIIEFFFENKIHWQSEVWLLLFTVCTCVSTFRPCLM